MLNIDRLLSNRLSFLNSSLTAKCKQRMLLLLLGMIHLNDNKGF